MFCQCLLVVFVFVSCLKKIPQSPVNFKNLNVVSIYFSLVKGYCIRLVKTNHKICLRSSCSASPGKGIPGYSSGARPRRGAHQQASGGQALNHVAWSDTARKIYIEPPPCGPTTCRDWHRDVECRLFGGKRARPGVGEVVPTRHSSIG